MLVFGRQQFYVHGRTPRHPHSTTADHNTIVTLWTPWERHNAGDSLKRLVAASTQGSGIPG